MVDFTGKTSPRENYLRILNGGVPDYYCAPDDYTAGRGVPNPIMMVGPQRIPAADSKDAWGVTWRWLPNGPAANPHVTAENKVIKDIRHWDKYLNVPWPHNYELDWTEFDAFAANFDRKNFIMLGSCFSGLFELSHYLMGFEDALTNYIEEPEAMSELLSVLTDYKLEYLKLTIEHAKPDMIHFHDDWGNKKNLFLSPATWRKVLKPQYERIYGYLRSQNVIIQHHADCVCAPILEDMIELGIKVWHGCIPQNDIVTLQKLGRGRMTFQGGIDGAVIDFADISREKVEAEVKRAFDTYTPGGNFVPLGICINPNVREMLADVINDLGADYFNK